MTRHVIGVFVAAVLVCGAQGAAAQDAFLLVPGIPGGSLDARHKDWIDLISISQTFDRGAPRKQQACTVVVTKPLDKAGPLLWAAAVTGQSFPTLTIEVLRAAEDPVKYYELVLNNAAISSITTNPIDQVESLTLEGASATLTFFMQRPDGSMGDPVSSTVPCK